MTTDDRVRLEKGLDAKVSLHSIALQLSKDPITIAKEIKKNRTIKEHNTFNKGPNKCALLKECTKKHIYRLKI